MRKLSEIPAEEGMVVIGKAIPAITEMVKKAGKKDGLSNAEYFGKMLENAPKEAVKLCSAISGEDYSSKGIITVMQDLADMVNDDNLMELFSSQM